MQWCVSIDVDGMRLDVEAALQEETHDLMVTEAGAEVERDVVLVVLGVHCVRRGNLNQVSRRFSLSVSLVFA